MTKSMSDSRKRKQKKKKTEKFLATAPGTKLHRVEFIETQKYINGVRNERGGDLVIRSLNEEEKAWLANFNSTFEHGNFKDDFMELSPEQRTEINHQDYARKSDLYFKAKSTGNLIAYDLCEYDKFETEAEKDISLEDLKLNYLQNKPKKTRRQRGKRAKAKI
jgi:hypothetical protein